MKQIFTTDSRLRWNIFQWATRSILIVFLIMIPVVVVTLVWGKKPLLPGLAINKNIQKIKNPVTPKGFTQREEKKYKGYSDFLLAKRKNEQLIRHTDKVTGNRIRAAFFVDWDPQSFFSLQKNISKLNMVLPEWFFIDPSADTLKPSVDAEALTLMKRHGVKIIPIINNVNESLGEGQFDGRMIHRILHNKEKRERLIADIIKYLQKYQLQGINIDFEDLKEKTDNPLIAFQKELYENMHAKGLLVTQDITPENEDFNIKELAKSNDFIFLMAYDQYYSTSVAGPVSSQRWIEKTLDETSGSIASEKIVLCIAGYGYDWPEDEEATTLTYQQVMATAKENHARIIFDNDTYNNHFRYTDADSTLHQVFFADAATNFNTIRFADEYGTAGTALWRLGSEDERLWKFYNRDLSDESMRKQPFDFSVLQVTHTSNGSPDYIGDGEILNVMSDPEPGKMQLETDSTENIISEQYYLKLPTHYVIKKYGNVKKQVILTFDDGPDPVYTPAILKILKKENVPATFFVIGMNAEENLPLLKRIYKEGHEIGNHTFTHPNIAEVSRNRALAEMESTRLLIESALGRSTVLFRAPYNADAEPTKEVELKPVALSRDNNYYT
ncbi:MAG TPA: polysaccharide deacetylase family protein, partial [Flavitalea sp.]|nr:polysaccharide deacetylase family protein [Flavitalea sp.]